MKRGKSVLNIIVFFLFLFLIALSPMLLTSYQNESLLNTPHITVMTEIDQQLSSTDEKSNISILDRINVIVNVSTQREGVMTKQTIESSEREIVDYIVGIYEKQLSILHYFGALPTLPFSDGYELGYVAKITYRDNNLPSITVSVWDLTIFYPDYSVFVTIDTETLTIYSLEIIIENSDFSMDTSKIRFKNFSRYLQIPDEYVLYNRTDRYNVEHYVLLFDDVIIPYTFIKSNKYLDFGLDIE